jgi:hypothetical protein
MDLYTELSTVSTDMNGFSCGKQGSRKRKNVLLKYTKIVICGKKYHKYIDIYRYRKGLKNV